MARLLPGGGFRAGTLIEWLESCEGSGAGTLALVLAAQVQAQGVAVVVIDERGDFYPPAAQALGILLERTLVVRPGEGRAALWAWEQALRCPAVAVVVGWRDKLGDRVFRRLQLAAEAGGGLGFLLRPAAARAEPSWAEARLLVQPVPGRKHAGRRWRVEVLYARGGLGGTAVELELSDETPIGQTHLVHLAAPVARAASARRAAGA